MPNKSVSDEVFSALPQARGLGLDEMAVMLRRFRETGKAAQASLPNSSCNPLNTHDKHAGSGGHLQVERCEPADGNQVLPLSWSNSGAGDVS